MKNLPLVLVFVMPALAATQARLDVPGALSRAPGEIAASEAIDRAVAFMNLVGEGPIDRRRLTYFEARKLGRLPGHVYNVDYDSHHVVIDTVSGEINFYTLASDAFPRVTRRSLATAPRGPVAGPTAAQARSLADATARAVGLPPGARLMHFAVRDQNPHADADMRGYVSAVYVGSDRSSLRLTFDRASGRLEMLLRLPPPRAQVLRRAPILYKGGGFPLPPPKG